MSTFNRGTVIVNSISAQSQFNATSNNSSLATTQNTLNLVVPANQFFIGVLSGAPTGLANNFQVFFGIAVLIGTTVYHSSGNENRGVDASGYAVEVMLGPGSYTVQLTVGALNSASANLSCRHSYSGFLYQTT